MYLNLRLLFLVVFIMILALLPLRAQDSSVHAVTFWDRVQFGGGLGLNLGNGFFSALLAPNAVYNFNEFVAVGAGLNGMYTSEKDVFKSTVLGASALTLVNPVDYLQVSATFEQLYVNRDFNQDFVLNEDDSYWYPALFFGLGYRSGNAIIGVRYDVLYDNEKSIQPQAWMPFVMFWF